MGRKKKRQKAVIFCYYCDRVFDSEKVLIQHQRAKHFKCPECYKKINSTRGMMEHAYQVHKVSLETVPNAKPGRDSFEIDIFGMGGVPPEIVEEKRAKIYGEPAAKRPNTGGVTSVISGPLIPGTPSTLMPVQMHRPQAMHAMRHAMRPMPGGMPAAMGLQLHHALNPMMAVNPAMNPLLRGGFNAPRHIPPQPGMPAGFQINRPVHPNGQIARQIPARPQPVIQANTPSIPEPQAPRTQPVVQQPNPQRAPLRQEPHQAPQAPPSRGPENQGGGFQPQQPPPGGVVRSGGRNPEHGNMGEPSQPPQERMQAQPNIPGHQQPMRGPKPVMAQPDPQRIANDNRPNNAQFRSRNGPPSSGFNPQAAERHTGFQHNTNAAPPPQRERPAEHANIPQQIPVQSVPGAPPVPGHQRLQNQFPTKMVAPGSGLGLAPVGMVSPGHPAYNPQQNQPGGLDSNQIAQERSRQDNKRKKIVRLWEDEKFSQEEKRAANPRYNAFVQNRISSLNDSIEQRLAAFG